VPGLAHNISKFSQSLRLHEWLLLVLVAITPIITVRLISMFYIGLVVFGLVISYGVFAVWDYSRAATKKQRSKKAQHYTLVSGLIVASFFVSIVYLMS
jgi:hypothetical protein